MPAKINRPFNLNLSREEKKTVDKLRAKNGSLGERAGEEAVLWAGMTWAAGFFLARASMLYDLKAHKNKVLQVATAVPFLDLGLGDETNKWLRPLARLIGRPLAFLSLGIPLAKQAKKLLPSAMRIGLKKKIGKTSDKMEGWMTEKAGAAKAKAGDARVAVKASAAKFEERKSEKTAVVKGAAANVYVEAHAKVSDNKKKFEAAAVTSGEVVRETISDRAAEAKALVGGGFASAKSKFAAATAGDKSPPPVPRSPSMGAPSPMQLSSSPSNP